MKMKFLFVLSLVFVMSSFAFAQSPAGKWTGEMPGGRGGANPVVFEFTVAGTTLTGTITVGAGMATPITAGTIAGDTITFQAPAGGGGGGGRGGGGGAAAGGAPPAAGGAPPAAAAGAPPAGGGGGGQGRGGGGGGLATYTGKVTATEIAFSRVGGGGGGGGRGGPGGGGAPGGAPPAGGGAPPAAGAAPAPGAAPAAPAPVTFTVKKG